MSWWCRPKLSAIEVNRLRGSGFHGAPGLGLQITKSNGPSWVLQFNLQGKRPEMGLGPFPEITLANARETAVAAPARKPKRISRTMGLTLSCV